MPNYIIRQATEKDVPSLVDFNCGIAAETEDKQLDRELVTRGVTRALQQGEEAVYFVAVEEGDETDAAVASLMLTREWSDWRDGWVAWIQSVYVHQAHRGNGIFTLLLEHATAKLKTNPDVRGLRLYVENDNTRAQSVYHNNGFNDPHYKVLEKMF